MSNTYPATLIDTDVQDLHAIPVGHPKSETTARLTRLANPCEIGLALAILAPGLTRAYLDIDTRALGDRATRGQLTAILERFHIHMREHAYRQADPPDPAGRSRLGRALNDRDSPFGKRQFMQSESPRHSRAAAHVPFILLVARLLASVTVR